MERSFRGKKALVTGAGRGIGRDVVKRLVEYGAEVVALSRTQENLITLKQECPAITTVVADVGKWEETKMAVTEIGPVDLLVNNAGVLQFHNLFGDVTEKEFDRFMSINVKGALNVAQVVANFMKSNGKGGAIVNVSSMLSKLVFPGKMIYSVTKAALDQLTRVMALELGPYNIRVNSINPGLVLTDSIKAVALQQDKEKRDKFMERIPLRRLSEVSDTVDGIMYLLSDQASMVHGVNLVVDGGQSI